MTQRLKTPTVRDEKRRSDQMKTLKFSDDG